MFNRSRRKIIISITGSLILLLSVTLTVIMLASYRELAKKNHEMLERYVEIYSLDRQPGSPEDLPDHEEVAGAAFPDQVPPAEESTRDGGPDYQLSTFYSVAFDEDRTPLAVDDGKTGIYSEDELVTIALDILDRGKESGDMDTLTYVKASKDGYTLIAFIDRTFSQSSFRTLQRNVLIVGGAAIAILLVVSFFIAGRIIRPLEENDRRQKRFISDASHELKTPVAVIGTNAELLRREIGENEWLANIQYENERMGDLIRQLLELSRAEDLKTPAQLLDFSRIVTGETLAFEALAYDRGKQICSDIEDDIKVRGYRTQLTQLVSALLDNAIRHSTKDEIILTLKRQGQSAVLNVINDAQEMAPEQLQHLFDRFYRIDEVRNSEEQHYGLGLSIAKASALKHGGTIGVSSKEGKVRFTVTIPVGR